MTPRATQTWGKINPGDAMTVSKAMPLAFAVAEVCFRSAQGQRFESRPLMHKWHKMRAIATLVESSEKATFDL
jgi:hypothetical protein